MPILKSHLILRSALLMSTFFIPVSAFAQSSPFAGDDTPMASEELSFPAPVYESTAITAPAAALSSTESYSVRGATSLNQSLAGAITLELPEGVSLDVADADESFLTIGAAAPASEAVPFRDDMDNEQAVELAEEVDSEQIEALGGGTDGPAAVGKFIVHYPVAYRNIPVSKFADVTAFVSDEGKVQSLRKRNLPTSLDADTASISTDDALARAVADAGDWAAEAEISGPTLEVWVDDSGAGQLSYRVELTNNGEDPHARRYWVAAAGDGEVIYWENMIRHQHFGDVNGTVWTEAGTATGPTSSVPLGAMTVTRSTGGSALTNDVGNYAFPSGAGVATMSGNLSGPHSVIDNISGSELVRNRNGSPAVGADLNFNASGAEEIAQTTAFYWTNRAHELAKDILNPGELANLPTNVNRPGSCNAFWNGSSINFYVAGGNCPNMAYDSVVLHEFGHGVDARKGGILNGGLSEGFGDVMSILGTRDSCVGQDFFGPNTCLRDAKDLIMWPLGSDGVHAQGRRYAGFGWELTQQLKTLYAEDTAFEVARQLLMGAAKANPSDIPDAVLLSFMIDDDDGDLTNGTPHFVQLAAAADSRNIPRPADPINNVRRMGFAWAHSPTSASYTPSSTYAYNSANGPVTARRLSVGNYEVKFDGLGGQGRAGGNVQVTGYGSSQNDCKVYFWSSGGSDFAARVRCLTPSGASVDDRFTILITWP